MSDPLRWRLVVPVKEAEHAKTRLQVPAPLARPLLARAIAMDTLEAVCRALRPADVLVVSSDPVVAGAAAGLGARLVTDPGEGLNAALRAGLRALPEPERPAGTGVLLGDLPALRPRDLLTALDLCAGHERAVVPDLDGTGTVLLTAGPGRVPQPRFGAGSAARHTAGATRLEPDLPRLRTDVDDAASLAAAVALGVGRHTARVLARADPA